MNNKLIKTIGRHNGTYSMKEYYNRILNRL